ncbi:MAG: hypothetical protein KIS87_03700 [Phycisphaeraceae bacterium]|nr:hypothetical protein [Phycisphaeraceae bacterium]
MSAFGTSAAQSVAGLHQAEQVAARDAARKEARRPRDPASTREQEELDRVEIAEAVRNLKDNAQEEAREDRQERPAYAPDGSLRPGEGSRRPSIDVQG